MTVVLPAHVAPPEEAATDTVDDDSATPELDSTTTAPRGGRP
ncbi:hypothetical protein [Blastococcus brunescens]|uniref:Uncharacterized protein n=1 Tax=Blastococcus brunescens TaxID=1564165 RepID=A0ABZ1B9A6_9ACTN|nr:hypothetical protein [Blastococcus sp. BMG 8361]WRL67346.1 hypothetical protein U6N30_05425 [Blastococcus sp. BMG 8361]